MNNIVSLAKKREEKQQTFKKNLENVVVEMYMGAEDDIQKIADGVINYISENISHIEDINDPIPGITVEAQIISMIETIRSVIYYCYGISHPYHELAQSAFDHMIDEDLIKIIQRDLFEK
jgi:hypothetical protein